MPNQQFSWTKFSRLLDLPWNPWKLRTAKNFRVYSSSIYTCMHAAIYISMQKYFYIWTNLTTHTLMSMREAYSIRTKSCHDWCGIWVLHAWVMVTLEVTIKLLSITYTYKIMQALKLVCLSNEDTTLVCTPNANIPVWDSE